MLGQNRLTCYPKELTPAKEGLRKVKALDVGRIRSIEVVRIEN